MKISKRVLSVALSLAIIMSLVCVGVPANAVTDPSIIIEIDDATVDQGTAQEVNVTVKLSSATVLGGFEFLVDIPDGISLTAISSGDANVKESELTTQSDISTNPAWIGYTNDGGVGKSTTVLAVMTFFVSADAALGDYTFDVYDFVANNGDPDYEEIFNDSNQPTVTGSQTITVVEAVPAPDYELYYVLNSTTDTEDTPDTYMEYDIDTVNAEHPVSAELYLKVNKAGGDTLQAFDFYVENNAKLAFESFTPPAQIGSSRVTGDGTNASTEGLHHIQVIGADKDNPINVDCDEGVPVLLGTLNFTLDPSVGYDEELEISIIGDTADAASTDSHRANIAVANNDESIYPVITGTQNGAEVTTEYTINYFDNVDDAEITVPDPQTKKYNETPFNLSSTKPLRENWTFKGWSKTPVATYVDTSSVDYDAGDSYDENANADLYAVWQRNTCTVTWYDKDHETVLGTSTVNAGEKPSYPTDASWHLPEAHADTAEFEYGDLVWGETEGATSGIKFEDLPVVEADISYYAVFPKSTRSYPVHWKGQDTTTDYGTSTVLYGEKPTYPEGFVETKTDKAADSRYSYTFAGWTDDPDLPIGTAGKPRENLDAVSGEITYYATYTRTGQTYNVTLDPNGGTPAPSPAQTVPVTYGEDPTTLPTTVGYTLTGYVFTGWNTQPNGTGDHVTEVGNLEAPLTLYAEWTPITYQVRFNGNGNTGDTGDMTSTNQVFTYDQNPPVSLRTNTFVKAIPGMDGKFYVFSGWSKTQNPGFGAAADLADEALIGVGNNLATTATIVDLYAIWTQADYVIDYTMNGGTNYAGNPTSFNKDTGATIDNTVNMPTWIGYTFLGWTTDDIAGYTEPSKTVVIPAGTAKDVTLSAHWDANPVGYTIQYWQQQLADTDNTRYDDAGTDTNTTAKTGSTVTLDYTDAAFANKFEGFSLNTTKSENGKTVTVDSDGNGNMVINVYYDRNENAVSYRYTNDPAIADTTALPEVANYRYGATVTVDTTVQNIDGYNFSGWSTDDAAISAGQFTMPAKPVELIGTWIAQNVKYYVEFYQQDLEDTDYTAYTKVDADTEHLDGDADAQTTVDFDSAAIKNKYQGFELSTYKVHDENTTIARDGSTIIKIYYDRLSYEVSYSYTYTAPAAEIDGFPAYPDPVSYKTGATVTRTENPAKNGYVFSEWTSTPEVTVDAENKFTMPGEPVAFTGAWSVDSYTATFDVNGGSALGTGYTVDPGDSDVFTKGYTIKSGDTLPTTSNGLFTLEWKVKSSEGDWAVGATFAAGTSMDGHYGNVTFEAVWTLNISYKIEAYKYAYQDSNDQSKSWYLIRLADTDAMSGKVYTFPTFNGTAIPVYYTTDSNYLTGLTNGDSAAAGSFYTLVPAAWVNTDGATIVLNATGESALSAPAGAHVTLTYDGDINKDGKVNIADANGVFQMLSPASAGGYYSLSQLDIESRLRADLVKATDGADNRASIEDVNWIVNVINGKSND